MATSKGNENQGSENVAFSLADISFADITPVSRGKASAAVRKSGAVVFSKVANETIDYAKNTYHRVGSDANGNIYLVPAKAEDANVVKAVKNGDSFMIKAPGVFSKIGAVAGKKYSVSAENIGGTDLFKLTPLSESEAAASETENEQK